MTKFIAFYLPQFYPTKENNEWWGAGFTDWRTVNMAKPLFKNHVQPKIPLDLGYYDLRLAETRKEQAQLALHYGIDCFCYWHYWFGNGKRLLNYPFDQVIASKEPQISFCLGWANHSWYKKSWGGKGKDQLLIKQEYLGKKDYILHFNTMLEAFKDKRYSKFNNKLIFIIYQPLDNKEEIKMFIQTWRNLAKENGLNDFFFIGKDSYSRNKEEILSLGFDAIYNDNLFGILHKETLIQKGVRYLKRKIFNTPMVFKYKDAIKYMLTEEESKENVIPVIAPNWDHSPRSGNKNAIFIESKPQYFEQLVSKAENIASKKQNNLVIVKSWNEWGEGNYLEPDLEYGKGMLEALRKGRNIPQSTIK